MTRPIPALLAVTLLGAGALWAADFWEKKKYNEWSPKEAQKMLKDSPWARSVDVRLGGGGGGMGGGGGRGRRGGGGGGMGGGGMSDAGGGLGGGGGAGAESPGGGGGGFGGGGGGGGMGGGPEAAPTISVVVQWRSAMPVKQAAARLQYGNEAATSKEAAERLARAETHYIAGVIGLPPQFLRGEPARMKQMLMSNAALKIRDREPLAPGDVHAERSPDGKANLYFLFPRDAANPIKLEDRDVELVVKLGPIEIKRKFGLKDMVFDGKLEI